MPSNSTENSFQVELITIMQFAQRLCISRSTAYNWLAEGRLAAGRHVLRIGRVVRILWSEELLAYLLTLSNSDEQPKERPILKRNGKGGRNRVALDADYLALNR